MPPSDAPNPAWQWLSPEEAAIVAAATDDYRPAKALAKEAELKLDSDLYALLGNLVRRNILESSPQGYRINRQPPDADEPGASRDKEGPE